MVLTAAETTAEAISEGIVAVVMIEIISQDFLQVAAAAVLTTAEAISVEVAVAISVEVAVVETTAVINFLYPPFTFNSKYW